MYGEESSSTEEGEGAKQNIQDIQIGTDGGDGDASTDAAVAEGTEEIPLWGWMLDAPHPKEPAQGIERHAEDLGWDAELGLIRASIASGQKVGHGIDQVCPGQATNDPTEKATDEKVAVAGGSEVVGWSGPDLCYDVGGRDI